MIYKNILIAVDDSDTSLLAIDEAIKFAKQDPKTKLRIIHIGDEFFINWDGELVSPDAVKKSIQSAALALIQNIEAELKGNNVFNFETKLIETNKLGSRVAEKIAEEATGWPADLIIVGTHGRRGFHRWLLGSVAEAIARIAPAPVLLIRGKEE